MFNQHSAQNGGVGGGVKKVSTNVGKYVQYITEILPATSYQLGFTPNRLNRSRDGTFALPIPVFNNRIYAVGDTTMSDISDWVIKKDKIERKLVCFTKGGHTTALQGDPGPAGPRGFKGDPGLPGPTGERRKMGAEGKHGSKGDTCEKGSKGDAGPVGPTGPAGSKGSARPGEKGKDGAVGLPGPAGSKCNVGS